VQDAFSTEKGSNSVSLNSSLKRYSKKNSKINYAGTKKTLLLQSALEILIQLQSYLKLSGNFVLDKTPLLSNYFYNLSKQTV
jgi:hypothetical protein